MQRARATLALVSLPALLAQACGESAPTYTLQQVMYQVDYLDKALAVALQNPGGASEAAQKVDELAGWWKDGAFARQLESSKFSGDRGSFSARRKDFDGILTELGSALGTGDLATAQAVHARLRATCDACHAEFRPELLKPKPS